MVMKGRSTSTSRCCCRLSVGADLQALDGQGDEITSDVYASSGFRGVDDDVPVVLDDVKYPGWGRSLRETTGEIGLAGHWIKHMLHLMFIYKHAEILGCVVFVRKHVDNKHEVHGHVHAEAESADGHADEETVEAAGDSDHEQGQAENPSDPVYRGWLRLQRNLGCGSALQSGQPCGRRRMQLGDEGATPHRQGVGHCAELGA